MKKLSIGFVLLLSFSTAFSQSKKAAKQQLVIVTGKPLSAQDSSLVESLFYSGLKEKLAQNDKLAADYFKRIIDIDPAHHYSYYELAALSFAAKDLGSAKNYIQKATTIKTDNEWYWLLSASIYQDLKDFDLLNYTLDELIAISPDKIEYSFDKANTLVLLKKQEEALKVYQNIEKKTGLTDELVEGKLRLYISQGNIKSAESDLNNLILKNPGNVNYLIQLGDLYFNNNQKDKALELYTRAKKLNPDNAFINLALSDIFNSENKPEEAFSELKIAFKHQELSIDQKIKIIISYFSSFPDQKAFNYAENLSQILTEVHADDPKSFSIYGDVLFQENELEKAKSSYEKAIALNKQVYAIWDQLIRINLALNNMPGVIKEGEEALTYFPNQAPLYIYTALAYNQLKQSDKAVSYLNNALNYDLERAAKVQVYSSLGDAYQELKKYKESSESYEKALHLESGNVYALNNYAYYLSLRDENLEKAEKMSLLSNELAPNNPSFLDTYAWILFRQKKFTEAKDWIEKAVKASENKNAVIIEHYGDILYHLNDKENALLNWKKALSLGEQSVVLKRKINENKYSE